MHFPKKGVFHSTLMDSGTAGRCKLKLFISCNGRDHGAAAPAPWIVLLNNHASDRVTLNIATFLLFQGRSAVVEECRHVVIVVSTPVLENHRDDKAPDDRSDTFSL